MKEISGDIWDYHAKGKWIVITTNGSCNKQGLAVMGRGTALDAAEKYPMLRAELGKALKLRGNRVYSWNAFRIITFPVKHRWFEYANLDLIVNSAHALVLKADFIGLEKVYMVQPGTGYGRLSWEEVKPVIAPILDDRFIVVNK